MAELTRAQASAVAHRGSTVLVSAAAGSGKTRVLIERVLRRVAEEGCDVDQFLMITFTEAAASELRGKLNYAETMAEMEALLNEYLKNHQ